MMWNGRSSSRGESRDVKREIVRMPKNDAARDEMPKSGLGDAMCYELIFKQAFSRATKPSKGVANKIGTSRVHVKSSFIKIVCEN